jgi:hypothetical protein
MAGTMAESGTGARTDSSGRTPLHRVRFCDCRYTARDRRSTWTLPTDFRPRRNAAMVSEIGPTARFGANDRTRRADRLPGGLGPCDCQEAIGIFLATAEVHLPRRSQISAVVPSECALKLVSEVVRLSPTVRHGRKTHVFHYALRTSKRDLPFSP